MTAKMKLVRRSTYRITSAQAPFGGFDTGFLAEKFADEITHAAMAGIHNAAIDQGRNVVLDEHSLRQAIRAGIAGYLFAAIEKRRSTATNGHSHSQSAHSRQTDV